MKRPFSGPRKPWLLFLPKGIQHQAEGFWIALILVISGLGILLGFAESSRISEALKTIPYAYNAWGGVLFAGGTGMVIGILRNDLLLEKLSRRFVSLSLLAYSAWAVNISGWSAIPVVAISLALAGVNEIRCAAIKYQLLAARLLKEKTIELEVSAND